MKLFVIFLVSSHSFIKFFFLQGILAENKSNEAHDKEVTELKKQLADLRKEIEAEKQDKNTLKKQSEALNKEYDRLSDEYNKLEKKLAISSSGDKKDDWMLPQSCGLIIWVCKLILLKYWGMLLLKIYVLLIVGYFLCLQTLIYSYLLASKVKILVTDS